MSAGSQLLCAQRPPRLSPGDRVAVITPCGPVPERSDLLRGCGALRELGLEPVLGRGVGEVRGHLAGSDETRANDLIWALSDPSTAAVWTARGGYGALRTIRALAADAEAVRRLHQLPPKIVIGFSDVTVINAFVTQRLGWVSFYGPGVTRLGKRDDYTLAGVQAALFEAEPFAIDHFPEDDWITTLVGGQAEGILAGGCLSLLGALVGTPDQVNFKDRICFFEDVNETPERIDRILTQLLAAGCFDGVRGIVIGEHVKCAGEGATGLEQVFDDLLVGLGVPTFHYLPIGHGKHLATLPIGALAQLDADRGALSFPESPVL